MHQRSAPRAGFTLIEMTAVILIIVILMGFIFTAGQNVLDRSRKVQAKNDETSIVTAVNAYYTEYGKYPLDSSKQGYDTLLGDPGGSYDNAFIFNILRAIADSNWNSSNVLNPPRLFFSGSKCKSPIQTKERVCDSGRNVGEWFND